VSHIFFGRTLSPGGIFIPVPLLFVGAWRGHSTYPVPPRHFSKFTAPRPSLPPLHPSVAPLPNAWLLCPPPFPRFVIAHVLPSSYTPPYGYPPAQPLRYKPFQGPGFLSGVTPCCYCSVRFGSRRRLPGFYNSDKATAGLLPWWWYGTLYAWPLVLLLVSCFPFPLPPSFRFASALLRGCSVCSSSSDTQ
jgi:hypothetical protein